MISTAPLYDVRTNRYKGVYAGPRRDQWDAIVQTPKGKLERKGRFSTPEEAARAIASYYQSVYGDDWATVLKNRSRNQHDKYRIRRYKRYPYRASLHRGPSVTVFTADVRLSNGTWHRVVPADIVSNPAEINATVVMWSEPGQGWMSSTAAAVAIRMYRATQPTTVSASQQATAPASS